MSSPYAEKIVTALMVKGLPWYSVKTTPVLPRKLLEPLTHGYRRIPIMQIGNDIYCDTAVIMDELDRRFPESPSGQAGNTGVADIFSSWVDKQVFGNVKDQMPWGATPEEQKASPVHAAFGNKALLADRAKLFGNRPLDIQAMRQAQPFLLDQLLANLETLESVLAPHQQAFKQTKSTEGGWILGSDKPSASDVTVYSMIWWLLTTQRAAEYVTPATYPNIFAWYNQMNLYIKKHAHPTMNRVKFTGEEALEVARRASSLANMRHMDSNVAASHPQEKRKVGEVVTVSPNDYGKVPVQGTIVEINQRRVSIRPEPLATHPDIKVVMHFPRIGYIIKPITPKAQL
ncbi:hypothetical protein BG004_007962 [Podila humilis]|nr:hypothetical protein BG004_007962 [Podila humilis]